MGILLYFLSSTLWVGHMGGTRGAQAPFHAAARPLLWAALEYYAQAPPVWQFARELWSRPISEILIFLFACLVLLLIPTSIILLLATVLKKSMTPYKVSDEGLIHEAVGIPEELRVPPPRPARIRPAIVAANALLCLVFEGFCVVATLHFLRRHVSHGRVVGTEWVGVIIGLALIAFITWAMAWPLARALGYRGLLVSGVAAQGQITAVAHHYAMKRGRSVPTFYYVFRTASGAQQTGSVDGLLFRPGTSRQTTSCVVLYNPFRPSRNALYPLEAYEIPQE